MPFTEIAFVWVQFHNTKALQSYVGNAVSPTELKYRCIFTSLHKHYAGLELCRQFYECVYKLLQLQDTEVVGC